MFCVVRGQKGNKRYFENSFDAENYAYELSEKYSVANVYLQKQIYGSWLTIAKYRDGLQVNGVLWDMFK